MSPADAERMMGEAQAKLGAAIATLGPLWDETYLPEIKRLLEPLAAFDLRGASLDELVAHWESVQATMNRLFEIHFLIIVPSYLAVSEFDELYIRLFQATDPHESYRLLQGIGNKTVDTSIALWELSRRARNLPEVRRVLTDSTDGDALDALERVEGGKGFVHELREYFSEYGQRGDAWDIAYPSWIEDPTPVLRTLREYLDAYSHPAVELQRTGAERERLVAAAREKLTDPADRAGFDFLLGAAEKGIVITEDHGFWIDFRGMHQVRMAVVEFGRRFADEGVIDEPQDVFFLHPAEITHTAVGLPALDRRELVAERRAALERARSIEPPPFVGAPPSEEPEEENPISRAMGKLFGGPPPAPSGDALRGHPGSAGVARGRARIISSIADADRLEPGDVLVAQATAPPWTPLFAIASAVVTDAGGILSHCAVVAREYQIPAVVGCGDATTRIRDGQTIEVDGDQGVVRVVG
jgi:pyruvate,water dikinase